MTHELPLQYLEAGQRAAISTLLGDAGVVHRLEEMGLRSGVAVEMVQSGTPCIIRVAGTKLCLRADDLLNVLVRPGGDE